MLPRGKKCWQHFQTLTPMFVEILSLKFLADTLLFTVMLCHVIITDMLTLVSVKIGDHFDVLCVLIACMILEIINQMSKNQKSSLIVWNTVGRGK